MCKCIKKAIFTFALATLLLILFLEEYYNKPKFFSLEKNQSEYFQKLLTNNHTISLHRHRPKKTRQYLQLPETPKYPHEFLSKITHTLLKNEERHARLSQLLEPVQRQAHLSEPTYNLHPTLPQDLSRIRHISQNQNTIEINRQSIHPRRNRNFQTPRVHFDIPQTPSPITPENPNSTLPETPTLLSQRRTSSIPSDFLGSTPTSEQIRDNTFNPPTKHHDYHIGQHTHSHKVN